MAGDALYTELLIGLGVQNLSMSAVAIPVVRSVMASTRRTQARAFARQVLAATSVSEVKELLLVRAKRRRGLEKYIKDLMGTE